MLYIFYLSLLSFFYHPIYISVLEIDSIDNDLQLDEVNMTYKHYGQRKSGQKLRKKKKPKVTIP